MEFVNSIAKIVHMEVSLHGGSPNKNIGDAFLLVWKLPQGFTSHDMHALAAEQSVHSINMKNIRNSLRKGSTATIPAAVDVAGASVT